MEINQISNLLSNRPKGSIAWIQIRRLGKTKAAFKSENIEKVSRFPFQVGVDYSNRSPVKQAVEDGLRDAPQLPKHIKKVFTLNGIKFWRGHNGKIYLPIPSSGERKFSQWLQDGKPVEVNLIREKLISSEFPNKLTKAETESKGQALFFAPTIENIESIA